MTAQPPATTEGHEPDGSRAAASRATALTRLAGPRASAIAIAAVCATAALYLGSAALDARHVRRAGQLGEQRRFTEAAAEARRAHSQPARARATLIEATALAELGDLAPAARAYADAARYDPSNWAIRRDWAVTLRRLGDGAGARRQMERALALNPRMELPAGFRHERRPKR
jgi:Flp pilus assembly protein TadD